MIPKKLDADKLQAITTPGKYYAGEGLYLHVRSKTCRSWVFHYQQNNIAHDIGLGSLQTVCIDEAWKRVSAVRMRLSQGIAPKMGRRNKYAWNITFDDCVLEFFLCHQTEWRSRKHMHQWKHSLFTYASPHFGKIPVCNVNTALVLRALLPIWYTKTTTALRLRGRIERVLTWATLNEYRDGENPARWEGHLHELLPNPNRIRHVRHYSAMDHMEIKQFWRALVAAKGTGARALEFTILTACRTSEVIYAQWSEIDFARRVWVIPAERMKGGYTHRIPLTDAAINTLKKMDGKHPKWIFPGSREDKPLAVSAMRDTLAKMQRQDVTVHGFRSSFRVWAAEETPYPREVAEIALAHRQAVVESAYQRSDLLERRRNLMQDWADWCTVYDTETQEEAISPVAQQR
jgi:integrase